MRTIFIFILLSFSFSAYSQLLNRDPYVDADEINFHLRNGKAYFVKVYNNPVSFDVLENKLMSYNSPGSGFQVKRVDDNHMNGVFVNYHLNWNYRDLKSRKIPLFMKQPANGTFEIEKSGNSYQVTVNNIWFSMVSKGNKQNHYTLEEFVTGKKGVVFTKNKKDLRTLKLIDENFQEIFKSAGSTRDTRF